MDQGTLDSMLPDRGGICGMKPTSTDAPTSSIAPTVSPAPSRLRDYPWPADRPTTGLLINTIDCPPEGCHACTSKRGACTQHSHCAKELLCWDRDSREKISGCDGVGIPRMNYCFDPTTDDFTWTPEVLTKPEPPVQSNVYFTHTPKLPERCETFVANVGGTVKVPFSGTSGKSSLGRCLRVLVITKQTTVRNFSDVL